MKPWMFLIPAAVLGGITVAYSAARSDHGMEAAAQQCRDLGPDYGLSAAQADEFCSCMVDRVRNWKDENPDAEYTRQAHREIGMTCLDDFPKAASAPIVDTRPDSWRSPGEDQDEESDWGPASGY